MEINTQQRIGWLSFEQFHGRQEGSVGSSMIRAKWLLPYWPQAEIFKFGRKYDVVIYQKAYYIEHAEMFKGKKIIDICDPDYLHWGCRFKQMVDLCDAVVCGTKSLAKDIRNYTDKPVKVIPDRVNLEEFKEVKQHSGRAKTVVWYGYSDNFMALENAIGALIKRNLKLIVISNRAFAPDPSVTSKIEVVNYPWNKENWQTDIMEGDIVINPKMTNGKWKYKSNNKTLNAWALGMPVAYNEDELDKFMDSEARKKEAEKRLADIKENYSVEKSVNEYKKLIKGL